MPATSPALMIAAFLPLFLAIVLLVLRQRMAAQLKNAQTQLWTEVEARKRMSVQMMDHQVASSRAEHRVGMAHEAAEKLIVERDSIREQFQALHVKAERMNAELTWTRNAVAEAGAERHDLSTRLTKATQLATAAQEELARGSDTVARAQQEALAWAEEADRWKQQLADLQRQGSQQQQQVSMLQTQLVDLQSQLFAAQRESQTSKGVLQTSAQHEAEIKEAYRALDASAAEIRTLGAELRAAKEREKALGEDLTRTTKQSIAPPPEKTDGVVGALEADANLNRGQRETLRMMYEKFTSRAVKR